MSVMDSEACSRPAGHPLTGEQPGAVQAGPHAVAQAARPPPVARHQPQLQICGLCSPVAPSLCPGQDRRVLGAGSLEEWSSLSLLMALDGSEAVAAERWRGRRRGGRSFSLIGNIPDGPKTGPPRRRGLGLWVVLLPRAPGRLTVGAGQAAPEPFLQAWRVPRDLPLLAGTWTGGLPQASLQEGAVRAGRVGPG